MKVVELYGRVRYAVQIEGLSRREAARQFGIDPRTVAKMLAFSVPPGYRRSRPPARPKLDPFTGIGRGGRTHRPRHGARVSYPCLRCRGSARAIVAAAAPPRRLTTTMTGKAWGRLWGRTRRGPMSLPSAPRVLKAERRDDYRRSLYLAMLRLSCPSFLGLV
jgi:hypothetical protein